MFIKPFEILNYFAAAVNSQKIPAIWHQPEYHIYTRPYLLNFMSQQPKKKNRKKDDDGDDVFLTVGH